MAKKSTVSCGKFLDIAHVSDLQKRISAAFKKKPEVLCLSADQIERVDTAGLQLLIATMNQCVQSKIEFKLLHASEVFQNTRELLGMKKIIPG